MDHQTSPISAYIICLDEVDALGRCLESLTFCRQIVIVDAGSTDGTLDLIQDFKARGFPIDLHHNDWPGFARQKQFALERTTEPWCLNVDCDERIDPDLAGELTALAATAPADVAAITVRQRDWLPGYGYAHPMVAAQRHPRMTRQGRGRYDPNRVIHEKIDVEGGMLPAKSGWLLHERAITLAEEVKKANRYSSLKVRQRRAAGKSPSLAKLVFSPFATFLKFYVAKRYFLCGIPGLIYARMMATYTFMSEAKDYRAANGEIEN
ncbi:glycosyltransferase family 2 protein [Pararhizobium haloflavum]|uniref:glycosyltransferase family 2 protein n=1 Tax=Pararhizobium haloflavum TaxID=2037914 RepID=UPI0012FFEF71|nr:glycosyltransferase family 2 protein [Pararhizobium haloflavum]